TPSFLNILRQKGNISSIKKALVTGEALPESLRLSFEDGGISVLQAYANADAGLIAYESKAKMGMIVAEDIIVEIVRPGTNKPVAQGEVGEIVITCFNDAYPLIRFATGDLSAVLEGQSPCGRTNMMIKGWLGRADQTTKVKGMFVHPEQIEQIVCHYPTLNKARLVVSSKNHNDEMLLICESSEPESVDETDLRDRIKAVTKLNGRVKLVGLNCIANDGKVIEDLRVYN
ncbi:MAG: phenylacetate--CoA ligase family protein, partial [Psychrobium sp.]